MYLDDDPDYKPPPKVTSAQRSKVLNSIYGARKKKKMKAAVEERQEFFRDLHKANLSPFNPLPAIGQACSGRLQDKTKEAKVIVVDKHMKIHDVLKPLTPLRLGGYQRKMSTESLDSKPQPLFRENTYDLLKPIFLSAPKVKKRECLRPSTRTLSPLAQNTEIPLKSEETIEINNNIPSKESAKSRFRRAAVEVSKLCRPPETGKLLCLRERMKMEPEEEEEKEVIVSPVSPTQRLSKLSEIFQSLEVKGRHRDKMKRENNWF